MGDDVAILSAPGESRECVEIARLVRREAERGVPFDRMAVLLRAPGPYRALLEEAFTRASVPAYFAQSMMRPDPSGRAFLALLACAGEGLSTRRFSEYLSLGAVPDAVAGAPPDPLPRSDRWVPVVRRNCVRPQLTSLVATVSGVCDPVVDAETGLSFQPICGRFRCMDGYPQVRPA
jgi:hypothetical protein